MNSVQTEISIGRCKKCERGAILDRTIKKPGFFKKIALYALANIWPLYVVFEWMIDFGILKSLVGDYFGIAGAIEYAGNTVFGIAYYIVGITIIGMAMEASEVVSRWRCSICLSEIED